jgi:signal transduction histidine kinase
MDFNAVSNIETCFSYVSENSSLIYYSHIPTAIVAILISLFVFFKSGRSLVSKILLSVSITFSLWSFFDLMTWISYDAEKIMFSWSMLGLLYGLIYVLSLYFSYVFFDKKDVSLGKKAMFFLLVFPVIFLTPTTYNLTQFDSLNCEASEGFWFTGYYHILGLFIFVWIAILASLRYRRSDEFSRKQILFFAFGIEFFLLAFFIAGYISSLLDNFNFLIYGLFGMPVFMAFLAYLIVKYKAFDIKLLGTQALVISLILLIGSQFFFVKTRTNYILTTVTFLLVVTAGILLIRSFKREEERKQELQEMTDKLTISNEKLRQLDNAKSEFISIASHQLRTPLTSIKGYVSLMLEGSYGAVPTPIMDTLNKVFVSNERLINLVENLLNISRIEAGRMQYRFEEVGMEKILTERYDTFTLVAKNKNLELTLDLPAQPLPLLSIDTQKMQEALSNLIDNAIKYTEKGGVTVGAKDMGTVVTVTVQDTGIGIPTSEIPYLFAKFSRGKDVRRLHANGTGLGLYVVKNIIEAHNGRIWIESEGEGQGTRFIIELPKEHREGGV